MIIQFCVLKLETTILTGQYDYWPAIIGFLILMFKDTIISLRIFYPNFHLFLSVTNVLYTPVAYLLANGIEANHYVSSQNFTAVDWLLTNKPHYFGLIPGWANPSGVFLLIVLLVMAVCSMKWVRKGGYFEVKPYVFLPYSNS